MRSDDRRREILAPMRMMSALLVVALVSGCTAPQAHRVRRPAELAIGASLVGVMLSAAGGVGAFPDHKPLFIGIAIGFGSLAVASAIVFGIAYANDEPPPPPLAPQTPDHRDEAWALTKQAQAAARANDCPTVVTLDAKVASLDESFRATVFARDVAIARCLHSSP
jgi:hypothetical protein